MALEDKIEAVKKVTEALRQEPATASNQIEMERVAPDKEHFQALFDTQKTAPSFQKIDGTYVAPDGITNLEQNPIIAQEDVSSQKSGSATDQERKRKQQDRTEAVEETGKTASSSKTGPSSLMEEVKKLNNRVTKVAQLNPEDLKNQAKDIIAQIENVKTQLSTPSTEVRPSYHNLLKNRLTHIDDTLKIALSKAGVEYVPPAQINAGAINPIERFIGYLTNSQYQLENLSKTIEHLNLTNAQLTPANMLALQIKVGYVQQQVELFTSLLNKALESTKTIMNVQV